MTTTLAPELADQLRLGTVVPYPGGRRPIDFIDDVARRVRGGYSPGGSNVRAMVTRALRLLSTDASRHHEQSELLRAAALVEGNRALDPDAALVVARSMDEAAIALRGSEPLEYLSDAVDRLVRSGAATSHDDARHCLAGVTQAGPGLVETRDVEGVLARTLPSAMAA